MNHRDFCNLAMFAVATLLLAGCQKPSAEQAESQTAQPVPVTIVANSTPSEADKESMLAAKDALFTKLSGRLMEAMGSQGPASAISVCQQEAPKIAEEVGQEQGVKIGRTGVRLRNPNNTVPQWAREMTEAKVDTPQFVSLTSGQSAALLPIKLKAQCLMCHGPKDTIAPVIQDQLAELYPNDEATGFAEGELRGWFWVEK